MMRTSDWQSLRKRESSLCRSEKTRGTGIRSVWPCIQFSGNQYQQECRCRLSLKLDYQTVRLLDKDKLGTFKDKQNLFVFFPAVSSCEQVTESSSCLYGLHVRAVPLMLQCKALLLAQNHNAKPFLDWEIVGTAAQAFLQSLSSLVGHMQDLPKVQEGGVLLRQLWVLQV